MSKPHPRKRDLMREQLAHQAARILAEDGITDFAAAKLKAARQLGAEDTRHLPSNEEIEAALRTHRLLFQHDRHPDLLNHLRSEALAAMQQFAPFHPYLTGSVLNGTAGEHSDINLTLYSDDAKAVLLFLLKHNIAFEDGEWRLQLGGREQVVPSYTLTTPSGIPVHLIVLPDNARHSGSRHPHTHADAAALTTLLAQG
ncbi:MAG: hypothetical protein Fur0040_06740 [Sideroxydans sp.]